MNQDQKRLQEHVKSIIHKIENGFEENELNIDDEPMTAIDYISDALDIEYIVTSDKQYKAARILITFGGPNIWINTHTREVEAYWWNDKCILPYREDAIGLDNAAEELFNC